MMPPKTIEPTNKISYMALHTPIFVPGVGQIGPTLTREVGKLSSLEMYKIDGGFLVHINGVYMRISDAQAVVAVYDAQSFVNAYKNDETSTKTKSK